MEIVTPTMCRREMETRNRRVNGLPQPQLRSSLSLRVLPVRLGVDWTGFMSCGRATGKFTTRSACRWSHVFQARAFIAARARVQIELHLGRGCWAAAPPCGHRETRSLPLHYVFTTTLSSHKVNICQQNNNLAGPLSVINCQHK